MHHKPVSGAALVQQVVGVLSAPPEAPYQNAIELVVECPRADKGVVVGLIVNVCARTGKLVEVHPPPCPYFGPSEALPASFE